VPKHQLSLKQVLVITVLVLLIAILLTSVTSKMVLAQSTPTINLNPAQGPPGATIYITGEGFRVFELMALLPKTGFNVHITKIRQ